MVKNIVLHQFIDLIKVLSRTEIEIAKKHIIAYDSTYTVENQKMFHLFIQIAENDVHEFEKLKQIISPESSLMAFNKLIRRSINRLQETLIIDVNINRKNQYSTIFRKRFEIRKLIMQAHILQGRGLPKLSDSIYNRIIRQTKQYELYDELIETLLLKQSVTLNISDKKYFEQLEKDVKFYHNCRELLQRTKSIYRTYSVELYTKGVKKDKLSFLEQNMRTILAYYKATGSANIKSQFFLLKMEYHYVRNEIIEEEETGLKLLALMETDKAVYSKPRISYVYNSMSNTAYANLNFKSTFIYIEKALYWSKDQKSINYIIALQQQINSLFFIQENEKVEEHIALVETHEMLNKYPYYSAKSTYQKAMNQFALGQFKKARILLINLKEIEKDKEGWNVWTRIMRILCSIELLRLNLIDYDVENFRRFIQRIDKQHEVRERDKLILRILRDLDRYNYDFKIVSKKSEDVLNQLRSILPEYCWDPKSPEMILFHDWFDAKLEKRTYAPNFEPYRKPLVGKLVKEELVLNK